MNHFVVLADTVGQARGWAELFVGADAEPLAKALAAFIAILIMANVTQFILLMRSKNAHLALAMQLGPLAEKFQATVQRNNEVIDSAADVLNRSADLYERLIDREAPKAHHEQVEHPQHPPKEATKP